MNIRDIQDPDKVFETHGQPRIVSLRLATSEPNLIWTALICLWFLASQDALEVMWVTDCVSEWTSLSLASSTDVTLVSDDIYWRLYWCEDTDDINDHYDPDDLDYSEDSDYSEDPDDPDDPDDYDDPDNPDEDDDSDDHDKIYLVIKLLSGYNLYCHKRSLVIKAKEVKMVKEVKRIDGL